MQKLFVGAATFVMLAASSITTSAIADDVDCSDFSTQTQAQSVLNADPSDPNNLDLDNNGIACESLANIQDDNSVANTTGSQVKEVPQGSAATGSW